MGHAVAERTRRKVKSPTKRIETAPASQARHRRPDPAARPGAFFADGPVFGLPVPAQAKPAIGRPGDRYEREADRVAERVSGFGADFWRLGYLFKD